MVDIILRNIAFVSLSPPSQRFVDAYGLPYKNLNSTTVHYICVREAVDRAFSAKAEPPVIPYSLPSSRQEVKYVLGSIKPELVVTDIAFDDKMFWLFWLFNHLSSTVVYIDYTTCGPEATKNISLTYSDFKERFAFFYRKIKLLVMKSIFSYKMYDAMVTRDPRMVTNEQTLVLPSSDVVTFTEYSRIRRDQPVPNGVQIVFLDVFLPFHQDLELMGLGKIDPSEYRREMCTLFAHLERLYGVPVVIAAHPSAHYSDSYFEGRSIVYGAACELIERSVFCVSHHSTSTSLAVLFGKRILFVHTNEMQRIYGSSLMRTQRALASALGCRTNLIDDVLARQTNDYDGVIPTDDLMSVSETYLSFANNYLSNDWPNQGPSLEECSKAVQEFIVKQLN